MSTEILEKLFSKSLHLAREKIDAGQIFKPFIMSINDEFELSIFLSDDYSGEFSEFINDFLRTFISLEEMLAFSIVQLTCVDIAEGVEADAITVHFEVKGGDAISALQAFGKDESGKWLFAEIDAQKTESILVKVG